MNFLSLSESTNRLMNIPYDILVYILSVCDIQTLVKLSKLVGPNIIKKYGNLDEKYVKYVQNLYKDEKKTNMSKSSYVIKPYVSLNYASHLACMSHTLLYLSLSKDPYNYLPYDCTKFLDTYAEIDLIAPSFTKKMKILNGYYAVLKIGDVLSGYSIVSKIPLVSMSLICNGTEIHRRTFSKGTTKVKMSSFSGLTIPLVYIYTHVYMALVHENAIVSDEISNGNIQVFMKYTNIQINERNQLSRKKIIPVKHFVYDLNNEPKLVFWKFNKGQLSACSTDSIVYNESCKQNLFFRILKYVKRMTSNVRCLVDEIIVYNDPMNR